MLSWSNRRDDESGDHPDPAVKATVVGFDYDSVTGIARIRIAGDRIPYSRPDSEQDDDVIEPTALFKPLILGNGESITIEHDQTWSNYG